MRRSCTTLKRAAHWLLIERLNLVPRAPYRPYALPAVARLIELRWDWTLRRRRVLELAEYGAAVEVGEAEELVCCPLCDGDRVQPLFAPQQPREWSYRVVRCPSCGMLYRNPGIRPERIADLYSRGGYARFLTGRYAVKRQDDYRATMQAFGSLFVDGTGRRLFDYGCGVGLFLEMARERGFNACGVDLAPDAVEEARRRGLRAWHGSPRDVPELAAGGFDVITMWSVLAHLPRPVDELSKLRRLLARNGALLVYTVNANSLLLKAYGNGWGGFTRNHFFVTRDPPRPASRGGVYGGRHPTDVREQCRTRRSTTLELAGATPSPRRRTRQSGQNAARGRIRVI